MKSISFLTVVVLALLSSCSDSNVENRESIPKTTTPEVKQLNQQEEKSDDLSQSLPINEDNKILYDALVPLGSNILPKEMNLAEDGFRLVPRSMIGINPGVKYTIYADFSIDLNGEHAVIIRVKSFDPDEIEVFQDNVQNYLVAFDEQWNIMDRSKIHQDNSLSSDGLTSTGWSEMENINIAWQKINLEDGEIMVNDEGTDTFDGSEDGVLEARQFTSKLHSPE